MKTLHNNPQKLKNCWKAVGQPLGTIDPTQIKIKKYDVGTNYRDSTLPKVTRTLLSQLFSKSELVKIPEEGFCIQLLSSKIQAAAATTIVEITNTTPLSNETTLHDYRLSQKQTEKGNHMAMYTRYEFYKGNTLRRLNMAIEEAQNTNAIPEKNETDEGKKGI